MNTFLKLASQFVILFLPLIAFSEEQCLSGKSGQTNLIDQLATAKASSSITQIIAKQYQLENAKIEGGNCVDCDKPLLDKPTELSQVAGAIDGIPQAPKLLFKAACLRESNEFKSDTAEVSCPSGQRSKSKNLCMTEKVMSYQNAVISSFLNCAKKAGLPTVSPSALYQMYSLESGFKPQFAYNGGVGIGQLTNIFVEDIHQKWRGYKFLEKIAQSSLSECEAAKIVAQKDIQSKPRISNSCSFISIGEGLERNILYSLIGMANSWEKDVGPKLQPYLNKYSNSEHLQEIKDLSLLNAYGPGGRAAARALVSRLSQLPPEKYLERIKTPLTFVNKKSKVNSLNIYTIRMAKRQKKIQGELAEPIKSEFAKQGAQACVNQ